MRASLLHLNRTCVHVCLIRWDLETKDLGPACACVHACGRHRVDPHCPAHISLRPMLPGELPLYGWLTCMWLTVTQRLSNIEHGQQNRKHQAHCRYKTHPPTHFNWCNSLCKTRRTPPWTPPPCRFASSRCHGLEKKRAGKYGMPTRFQRPCCIPCLYRLPRLRTCYRSLLDAFSRRVPTN